MQLKGEKERSDVGRGIIYFRKKNERERERDDGERW